MAINFEIGNVNTRIQADNGIALACIYKTRSYPVEGHEHIARRYMLVEDYPFFDDYSKIVLINHPYNKDVTGEVERITSPYELSVFLKNKLNERNVMKFRTGEEAILYFVENKNNVKIENQMTLKIIEDEGLGLQYQSNSSSNNPEWTNTIIAVVDIERVLRNQIDDTDRKSLMRLAIYGRVEDIQTGQPVFDESYERLSNTGKYNRVRVALQRFEAALSIRGYLVKL